MAKGFTRRRFLKTSALAGVAITGARNLWIKDQRLMENAAAGDTIDVGFFSLTMALEVPERSLSDVTRMAIQEINDSGGVAGRMINAIFEDGASDPKTYNEKAFKLVIQEKTVTIFGCYTTASRLAVRPVYEKTQEPVLLSGVL